jgi:hypothetical protein
MSYTGTTLPSVNDVDAELRNVEEVRTGLDAMDSCVRNMRAVLTAREQSRRLLRQELVGHAADLAARELQFCAAYPALTPEARMLSFAAPAAASVDAASAPTRH